MSEKERSNDEKEAAVELLHIEIVELDDLDLAGVTGGKSESLESDRGCIKSTTTINGALCR